MYDEATGRSPPEGFAFSNLHRRSDAGTCLDPPHGAGMGLGYVGKMIELLPRVGTRSRGSRGHAPLGCLPLWGREGVTLPNSTE